MLNGRYKQDCPKNRDLVTNFNHTELLLYRKAVDRFNRLHESCSTSELFITDDAYDINGRKISTLQAVRLKEPDNRKDIRLFWDILDELQGRIK